MKKTLCCSLIFMLLVQFNSFTNLRSSEKIVLSSSNNKYDYSNLKNLFAKEVGITKLQNRFKEKLSNLESPVIRKLDTNFNDITSRAASVTGQTITNSAAFDGVYHSRRDYYDSRKLFIHDKNFNEMENYLNNGFKSHLNASIKYDKLEEHASSFDKNKLNVDTTKGPYVR